MVKKVNVRKIERNRYKDFLKVANDFYDGSKAAFEFEYYNASGVLVVHSAIALADAMSIKLSAQKSSGKSHYDSITMLENVIPPSKEKDRALKHFRVIIDHKNFVSYSGELYNKKDIEKLIKNFERFRDWAIDLLQ